MINYVDIIYDMMQQPHYLLLILISLYLVAATLDFMVGGFIASMDKDVFSTRILQLGIVRKLGTVAIMILVIPLALVLPLEIGIYSLSILYIAIVISEIYSILAHIGIVKDGDKHKNMVGDLFEQMFDVIFSKSKKD